jgi:hypothetical protein
MSVNRISAISSANGKATRARAKPRGVANRKAKEQVTRWAHRYTTASIVLSAALNAFAAWHHNAEASTFMQVSAALVSGFVPLLVWGLSQLAGWLVRAKQRRIAYAAGGVGVGMLLLSVIHVSDAITLLTGQHLVLAGLLAVGIDCGLVVSELAAIMVSEEE